MSNFKQSVNTSIDGKVAFTEPIGLSDLGTPIQDNVKFLEGSFKDFDGNTISFSELEINDAILTINRPKIIVKSRVNGQPGSIKEYITADDYQINLQGTISALLGFPENRWQAFTQLESVPDRLKVVSKFLNTIFNIDYVVIEDFSAIQTGSINSYDITMTLTSDKDIDFTNFAG